MRYRFPIPTAWTRTSASMPWEERDAGTAAGDSTGLDRGSYHPRSGWPMQRGSEGTSTWFPRRENFFPTLDNVKHLKYRPRTFTAQAINEDLWGRAPGKFPGELHVL